jgi:hypothetical protein
MNFADLADVAIEAARLDGQADYLRHAPGQTHRLYVL